MTDPTPDTPDQPESASEAPRSPADAPKRKRGQKPLPEGERKRQWATRLSPVVIDGIRELASERGCSQSALIEAWYHDDVRI